MGQAVGSPKDEEEAEMKFCPGRNFLRAASLTAAVAGWGQILARVLQTAGEF